VSECHDIYDPIGYPSGSSTATEVQEPGTQCHDPYLATGACRVLSDQQGQVLVVQVTGRLDWATKGEFRDLMQNDCVEPGVIVDLSGASCDAAGTGVLLGATARAAERGQQLVFVVTDPLEFEVLVAAGLDQVVPVVASVPEAHEWFEAHGVATGPVPLPS
jgi:anti-anti-sigma factor